MTRDQLRALLAISEDNFVERKAGLIPQKVAQAAVAFANALPVGRLAVIFIGISDDGTINGVAPDDLEKVQQQLRRICLEDCYPPISVRQIEALDCDGKSVIAVVIEPSELRPHFTGHAYIRVGSANVKASDAQLADLIASRNSKAGRILRDKGRVVTVESAVPANFAQVGQQNTFRFECVVESCDAHAVTLRSETSGSVFSESLESIQLATDATKGARLSLRVPFGDHVRNAWHADLNRRMNPGRDPI